MLSCFAYWLGQVAMYLNQVGYDALGTIVMAIGIAMMLSIGAELPPSYGAIAGIIAIGFLGFTKSGYKGKELQL